MEASALPARIGLNHRISLGAPLLKLRSDEQLVELVRAGHEEAFHVIHDRYRQRLFAYTRQMLPGPRQDAEDALQDIFVRAYSGLRASDGKLALRAWLYRVAHNRCVDELRRPALPPPEVLELIRAPIHDPIAAAEQRESLRRLVVDVRRLPGQQRSALLMRELAGMTYAEVAGALGVSIPAVKSLLVRARVGLAQSIEARDTACSEIREELMAAHDRGVRPGGVVRRHLRDCEDCRRFRREVRGLSHQLAALAPALGPLGVLAKLGLGGGAGGKAAASGSAALGGGAAVSGGAAVGGGAVGTGGTAASIGILASAAGHVAPLLAAAVVAAGGAVELQHTISAPAPHRSHQAKSVIRSTPAPAANGASDPRLATTHVVADTRPSPPAVLSPARPPAVKPAVPAPPVTRLAASYSAQPAPATGGLSDGQHSHRTLTESSPTTSVSADTAGPATSTPDAQDGTSLDAADPSSSSTAGSPSGPGSWSSTAAGSPDSTDSSTNSPTPVNGPQEWSASGNPAAGSSAGDSRYAWSSDQTASGGPSSSQSP